jgi:hypothetical protein
MTVRPNLFVKDERRGGFAQQGGVFAHGDDITLIAFDDPEAELQSLLDCCLRNFCAIFKIKADQPKLETAKQEGP